CANVEVHIRPAPGIDKQADGGKGFDLRIWRYALFVSVSAKLSAHDIGWSERVHRLEQPRLLVAHRVDAASGRRVHRETLDHLQQMVLNHVANRPRLFVKATAPLHTEALGQRDLHAADVGSIPD